MGTYPGMENIPEPVEVYWNLFELMERFGFIDRDQDMHLSLYIEDKLEPVAEYYKK